MTKKTIEQAYEELRQIIDGGSESFTHDDAVQYLKDRFAQPKQVDLTDEEVLGLFGKFTAMTGKGWLDLYRMTEAKRKEKNT